MKNLNFYLYLLITGIFLFGCNKPAPTELIQDENQTQVEVITKNLNDESLSNGYDSTGVLDSVTSHSSIIYASGIKITSKPGTWRSSLFEAAFFDKGKPVFKDGKLIGYHTIVPGVIKFNNQRAHLVPLSEFIKSADSSLGFIYKLYNGRVFTLDPVEFDYGSNIDFQLKPVGSPLIQFQIPTPEEITGNLEIQGKRSSNNLKFLLQWDHPSGGTIDIIIGGVVNARGNTVPIYKLKIKDDGTFFIPSNLIDKIPADRFSKIAVTLIRKIEIHKNINYGTSNNDLYILTQSVHTIIFDSP
jgi:hypothetical protein